MRASSSSSTFTVSPVTRELLGSRDFLFYWIARILTTLGFQIVSVAVGWQVYTSTGSTWYLGLVGLAQFLPMLVFIIPAGYVADTLERRRIVFTTRAIAAVTIGVLAVSSLEGWLGLAGIFGAVAIIGAGKAFENPAQAAFLPNIVTRKQLPQALALASSAHETAVIVGPALGGLLYLGGPQLAYGAAAVFYGLASMMVYLIGVRLAPPARQPATLANMFSGFAFIRRHPMILGAISLDMFAVLLGGAVALLPVYAHDILQTGPVGLGILRASPAIGALGMALWLAKNPLKRNAGKRMFAAVIIFGAATIVFGLSTWFPLSMLALIVMGAADVISVVVRGTLVQSLTPDSMRGKVSAVNFLFIGTSNQLGEFESGATASLFGTVPAVVMGGIGTILVALGWMKLFPALGRVDRLDELTPEDEKRLA